MAMMNVSHVKTSSLAPQPTGPQSAQRPLVRQFCQRVRLIHELGQLAAPEELARGGHHRADVGQRCGRDLLRVADGHALSHNPLHTQQPHPQLILDQLANGFYTPVSQVINIVRTIDAIVDHDYAGHDSGKIICRQSPLADRLLKA